MKQSVSKLKKKADATFSKWIRARDEHQCYTCMKVMQPNESQCGHYISRAHNVYRFDERNCHAQCVGCNVFKKGNLTVYALRLINEFSTDLLREFEENKRREKRFTPTELLEIINKYK